MPKTKKESRVAVLNLTVEFDSSCSTTDVTEAIERIRDEACAHGKVIGEVLYNARKEKL